MGEETKNQKLPAPSFTRVKAVGSILAECFRRFLSDDPPIVAASIAFFGMLGVFPLSLICLIILGLFVRNPETSEGLSLLLARYLPMQPDLILENLLSISQSFGPVTLVSAFLLWWASSGVYFPIQKALDRAWEIKESRPWWRGQLVAMEMAVIVGFLLLLSIGLTVANIFYLPTLLDRLGLEGVLGFVDFFIHAGVLLASVGVTVALFLLIYPRGPNRTLSFREARPSALFAAVFWEAARSIFILLLPHFNYRRIYGSIGVVVMLMTWSYISSLIMLLGAQLSPVIYRTLTKNPRLPSSEKPTAPLFTSQPDEEAETENS